MLRVLDNIDAHLAEPLDVAQLSSVAAFSPFHFQRQFAALFGIGVGAYLRGLRLKQAGLRLAYHSPERVTGIALDAGYESGEAFARAFRGFTGQTPSAFRRAPDWSAWSAALIPLNAIRSLHMSLDFGAAEIRIIDFPTTRVALVMHHGPQQREGEAIRRFIEWRKANGLPPHKAATFNVCYNDPFEAGDDYRLGLAVAYGKPVAPNGLGVENSEIGGGRCALLRFTGPTDDMRPAWTFLYGEWLPESGEDARDAPPFMQRVFFGPDVAPAQTITDLFLPLM